MRLLVLLLVMVGQLQAKELNFHGVTLQLPDTTEVINERVNELEKVVQLNIGREKMLGIMIVAQSTTPPELLHQYKLLSLHGQKEVSEISHSAMTLSDCKADKYSYTVTEDGFSYYAADYAIFCTDKYIQLNLMDSNEHTFGVFNQLLSLVKIE